MFKFTHSFVKVARLPREELWTGYLGLFSGMLMIGLLGGSSLYVLSQFDQSHSQHHAATLLSKELQIQSDTQKFQDQLKELTGQIETLKKANTVLLQEKENIVKSFETREAKAQDFEKNKADLQKQNTDLMAQAENYQQQMNKLQHLLSVSEGKILEQQHKFAAFEQKLQFNQEKNLWLQIPLSASDQVAFPQGIESKIQNYLKKQQKAGMKTFQIYAYASMDDDILARQVALKRAIEMRSLLLQQGLDSSAIEMRVMGKKPAFDSDEKSIDRIDLKALKSSLKKEG
jgi:hypothetical protein